jgi:hypothetical protein
MWVKTRAEAVEVGVDLRPAGRLAAGLPAPIELEALAVPLGDGLRFGEEQRRPPARPHTGEPDPEDAVARTTARLLARPLESTCLLSPEEVLSQQGGPAEAMWAMLIPWHP